MNKSLSSEQAAMLYGNRFLTEDAPDGPFPASGMSSLAHPSERKKMKRSPGY